LNYWEKRFASGKAEFFVLYGGGGLEKLNSWLTSVKESARYFLSPIWVPKISLRTTLSSAVEFGFVWSGQMNAVYST